MPRLPARSSGVTPRLSRLNSAGGLSPASALLAVDISDVTCIGHDVAANAQHVARWPAGEEYLRRFLTPTSLGPLEPVDRLLAHGQLGSLASAGVIRRCLAHGGTGRMTICTGGSGAWL